MSFGVGEAAPDPLSLAVSFRQAPGSFPDLLRGRGILPSGISILLRLAGGVSLDDEEFVAPPVVPVPELRKAARFFIEQVLLARDSDHYRILGVSPDASIEEIKENHRLLMRIFHPDRMESVSEADAGFAARINLAYNALRLPADRAAYDTKLRQATKTGGLGPRPTVHPVDPRDREPARPTLPPFIARHLPQLVLGSVALVASLSVGVVYLTREPTSAIGGGEGRVEPLSSPMRLAMRDQSAPPPSHQGTPASSPSHGATLADGRVEPATAAASGLKMPEPTSASARMANNGATDLGHASEPTLQAHEARPATNPLTASAASRTPPEAPLNARAAPPENPVKRSAPKPAPTLQMANNLPAAEDQALEQSAPRVEPSIAVSRTNSAEPVILATASPAPAVQTVSAPAIVAATTPVKPLPSAPPAPKQLTQSDLAGLVETLSSVYAKGDIDAFLALFSDDAHIEHGGKDRIRADYGDLFQSTAARQLYVWDMSWTPQAGGAYLGQGNYQAKVVRKGENQAHVYEGKIKLEVVPVNGAPRFRAMYH